MTKVALSEPKAHGIVQIKDKDGNVKGELELTSIEVKKDRVKKSSEETDNAANDDSNSRNAGRT